METLLKAIAGSCDGPIFNKFTKFVAIVCRVKREILLAEDSLHPASQPPPYLPPAVLHLLADSCDMRIDEVDSMWTSLRHLLWDQDPLDDHAIKALFLEHGADHGFPNQRSIWPPSIYCTDDRCSRHEKGRKLQIAEQQQAVLYTLQSGPVPVYAVQLKCKDCGTTYHTDYLVKNQERTYYGGVPDIIQVATHHFVEAQLIKMWKLNMNMAHMSAGNCAATYLRTFLSECRDNFPRDWSFKPSLNGKHVWTAFVVVTLLEDCKRRSTHLVAPDGGKEAERFTAAILEHNERMRTDGQPQVNHSCSVCVRVYEATATEPAKQVHAVVMDGITLGRPTCGSPHCPEPLANTRQMYCEKHKKELAGKCGVIGCTKAVEEGRLTCTEPLHRAAESLHLYRTKDSQFQHKERRERTRAAHPRGSVPLSEELKGREEANEEESEGIVDEVELTFEVVQEHDAQGGGGTTERLVLSTPDIPHQGDQAAESIGKTVEEVIIDPLSPSSSSGSKKNKIRVKFTRTRSHNEQIIVCPCGIIVGRETFLHAESMSACAEFIKRLYYYAGRPMPDHIIFDNNCNLSKHVRGSAGPPRRPADPAFANTGLAVDVFHFTCKHSKTDKYCQDNCNPANFPELRGEGDKWWWFNTSIAEQTNGWLGGYLSICREMLEERYDFFLNEMILMHNEHVLEKLEAAEDVTVFT